MAKLDIDFILLDESVVMNGFRALTSGAKLEGFLKNPVMLLMHNRATPGMIEAPDNDVMLPIGKWYDIRVINQKLLAKPDFDNNDPFALKIESKVKGGYLKGASIWIDPIACSDDEKLMIAGQRGPTITEWGVLEASIVDIPNCRNALAIKNSAGNKITLSGTSTANDAEVLDYLKTFTKLSSKNTIMDKKTLCLSLGLPETATEAQITEKLMAIQNDATLGAQLSLQNKTLSDEVIRLKKEASDKTITDLVDGAIAATKLAAGDREDYIKLATADFETTKKLIDGMKAYESISDKLSANTTSAADKMELEILSKLSGHELYMQGKLSRLKDLNMDLFKLKYKEALNVDYVA